MSNTIVALNAARNEQGSQMICTTVVGRSGKAFLLADPIYTQARRAISCLVEPEAGDTVLLAVNTHPAPAFILAILTRSHEQGGAVVLPGGSTLHDTQQGLTLKTPNLHLASEHSTHLESPQLHLRAESADVQVGQIETRSESINTHTSTLTLQARTVTSQVGRLIQRAIDVFRHTEKLDETRAGRMKINVQGHHTTRAAHVTTQAEGFVKIDGQQIDLG